MFGSASPASGTRRFANQVLVTGSGCTACPPPASPNRSRPCNFYIDADVAAIAVTYGDGDIPRPFRNHRQRQRTALVAGSDYQIRSPFEFRRPSSSIRLSRHSHCNVNTCIMSESCRNSPRPARSLCQAIAWAIRHRGRFHIARRSCQSAAGLDSSGCRLLENIVRAGATGNWERLSKIFRFFSISG